MKKQITLALLAFVFGGFLFCQPVTAYAEEPPLWMIGKFRTFNQKYRTGVQISISENGAVVAKSKGVGARWVVQRGTFEDRRLILDGITFDMQWRRSGFRLTQRDDPDNVAEYTRTDDYGDRFENSQRILNDSQRVPDSSYRVADALTGVWRGTNHKYRAKVTINIASDGRLTAIGRFSDGHETVQRGSYSRGQFVIDGETYALSQRAGGLRLRQLDDSENVIDLMRSDSGFGRDPEIDEPPSWLAGVFTGYNRRFESEVRIEIQPSGRVVSRITKSGKTQTAVGAYRRGRIRIVGGATYDVERVSGGVRLMNIDDERDADVYRRGRDLFRE